MIRKPLQTVYSNTFTGTTNSSVQFNIVPFDVDSLVVKLTASAIAGGSGTLNFWLQTTDDGGTTWFDLLASPQLNLAVAVNNASAYFFVVPLTGGGDGKAVGQPTASSLSANTVSGMPILSNRFQINYTYASGTVASVSWTVAIYAHNQSGGQY